MFRVLLTALCINIALSILAQDSLSNYIFNQLDQREALADYQASFFHQDREGYLWMSSNSGYFRFDGKRAKNYRPNNLKNSFNPIVNSKVFEDKLGNRWFSTAGGLHRIDHLHDTLASYRIYCAAEKRYLTEAKLFYLNTGSKSAEELWVYNDPSWYKVSVQNPRQAKPYKKLVPNLWRINVLKDANNQLSAIAGSFLGYGFYLHYFDQQKNKAEIKLKEHMIANLANEADSVLWIASMSGLIKYDLRKDTLDNLYPPLAGKTGFLDVNLWGTQYLILASLDHNLNVYRFDKRANAKSRFVPLEQWKKIEGEYKTVISVNKAFVDRWHNLWFANWRTGLYSTNLKKSYFKQLIPDKSAFVPGKYLVHNMAVDAAGALWFVVNNDNSAFQVYYAADQKQLQLISTDRSPLLLIPDPHGSVWVVKNDSLKKFSHNRWIASIKCDLPIKEIDLAPDGMAIARTNGGFRLINLRDGNWKTLPNTGPTQISTSTVNSVFLDKKGYCFINRNSHELLIFKLKNQRLEFISKVQNFGRVNALIEDNQSKSHWVASSAGLFQLIVGKKEKPIHFSKQYKELNHGFNGLLQDPEGKLWLSTNNTILSFDPNTKQIQAFSESDGTIGGQYIMGGSEQNRAGKLFFGSTNGVNIIEPRRLVLDSIKPRLFCEQILVNGQAWKNPFNVGVKNKWKFAPDERNLTFIFTTLDFISAQEDQFKYRLKKKRFWDKLFKDNEGKWVDLGSSNTFTLTDLAKGNYVLEVIASNSDGIWMEVKDAKRYTFRVKPYLWETTWFKGGIFLCALGVLYWGNRSRIRRIQRNAHLVDTELKVLRLQMNPHFIYNCLASIQRYVIVAKVDQANGLITSFAKLMRKILTDSVKSNLLIVEEIELLESYLLTESLRFEDKFDYTIAIDPLLDPEEVAIPTMIMQPFVENAIIHGMAKLDGKGHIRIFFGINEGMLECSVEDNGVGFSKSLNRAHESKAIEITERRLKLLPKTGKEAAFLKMVDLKQQDPNLSGVRIIIRLPLHLPAS